MAPCKILAKIYGLIDKSVFDTILKTWRKTEIPPSPSKNAERIMLIEICFIWIVDIKAIPFVISKIPVRSGDTKEVGIVISLNAGEIIKVNAFNRRLALNIDIITENITTKPPIIIIVEVAFEMLAPITSPKLENETFLDFEEYVLYFSVSIFKEALRFQNLNKNPTVRHARICVINSIKPM